MDDKEHGLFATRASKRPNPVGISIVRLKKVEGWKLDVQDIDIVDGTPLLDIRPYVPEVDSRKEAKSGWVSAKADRITGMRADRRFK